jgi:hypothetical protein
MPKVDKFARAKYDREYREKNKEKKAAYEAQWRIENSDHLRARGAKRRLEKRAQCLINAARTRSRTKGIVFDLEGFESELQARIDLGKCELSGIDLDLSPGRKPTSPSLDRIKPELGYVPGNVRIICHALNAGLGDWGEDAFAYIAESWLKRRASLSKQ